MLVLSLRGRIRTPARYIRSNQSEFTDGTGIVSELSLLLNFGKENVWFCCMVVHDTKCLLCFMSKNVGAELHVCCADETGNLLSMDWYDYGCSLCGGTLGGSCVRTNQDPQQTTCASESAPQSSCAKPAVRWHKESSTFHSPATCFACVANIPYACCPAAPFNQCACRANCTEQANCTLTTYVGFRGTDKKGEPMQSAYQITQINKFSLTGFWSGTLDKVRFTE